MAVVPVKSKGQMNKEIIFLWIILWSFKVETKGFKDHIFIMLLMRTHSKDSVKRKKTKSEDKKLIEI